MASSYINAEGDTVVCSGRHYAVMEAIKGRVAGLNLESFPNDRIEVLKQPLNRGIMQAINRTMRGSDGTAAMVISPAGHRIGKRKNNARDIDYLCRMVVFEASNLDNRDGLDRHCGWNDAILDEFDDYPFSQVPGGQRIQISPQTINPLEVWLRGFDAQTFLLTATLCVSRPWNP